MLPGWSESELLVNGALIHYYRAGGSGKPPLVLAHGFSDNGLCWHQAAVELEGEFDVIMPDARGHGLSARVQRGEKLDMPADLAEVICALGLERPVVGGHSMGAAVAAQLASRFPSLVRAVILEDPPWFLPAPAEIAPRVIGEDSPMKTWIQSLAEQPLEQVMAQCRVEHPAWPEIVVQTWCLGKKWNLMDNWQETARSIACPALLITADPEKGGIITPEAARRVAEVNPNFRVAHIPGVGHHVRFENHALYMDAVRAFLREL